MQIADPIVLQTATRRSAPVVSHRGEDRVELGSRPVPPARPPLPPARPVASLSQDLGQVQIRMEGRDLFAPSKSLGFLGAEAARTIGDGARWRHPFPQEWPWPPREPGGVEQPIPGQVTLSDPEFVSHYAARPELRLHQDGQGGTHLDVSLQNLSSRPQHAWVVAPCAMPPGHRPETPQALAVFPLKSAEELDQLSLEKGEASRTWRHDKQKQLLFVAPGAALTDDQQKAYFTPRPSLFGRVGDRQVMLITARGDEGPQAFQVFAGIHDYVELEWLGPPDAKSKLLVSFRPVRLDDLDLRLEGQRLQRLGESSLGLQAELAAVAGELFKNGPMS